MSAPLALAIGDRVRVGHNDVSTKFVDATGTVEADKDPYGRFGVRLDHFPRARKHWLHWFVPEVLLPIGEPPR